MSEEQWKSVPWAAEKYEVSNFGRVRSVPYLRHQPKFGRPHFVSSKILATTADYNWNNPHLTVDFRLDGKNRAIRVAELVAAAFVENPNQYPEIGFVDGVKTNCRADNLFWCLDEVTKSVNQAVKRRIVGNDLRRSVREVVSEWSRQNGVEPDQAWYRISCIRWEKL